MQLFQNYTKDLDQSLTVTLAKLFFFRCNKAERVTYFTGTYNKRLTLRVATYILP